MVQNPDIATKVSKYFLFRGKSLNLWGDFDFMPMLKLKYLKSTYMSISGIVKKSRHMSLALHTKVEFSRREFEDDSIYEPVDSQIIRQYSLSPFMTNHYSIQSMFRQKIRALALRGETQ